MPSRVAVKNLIRGMSCNTCLNYMKFAKKESCWVNVKIGQYEPRVKPIPPERTCEEWEDEGDSNTICSSIFEALV